MQADSKIFQLEKSVWNDFSLENAIFSYSNLVSDKKSIDSKL